MSDFPPLYIPGIFVECKVMCLDCRLLQLQVFVILTSRRALKDGGENWIEIVGFQDVGANQAVDSLVK